MRAALPVWRVVTAADYEAWDVEVLKPWKVIEFRLQCCLFEGRVLNFYECEVEGCSGCGCPAFEGGMVEDEVLEHLKEHAVLGHWGD